MTTATRSSNGINGNGRSAEALACVRRLKSGASANAKTAASARRLLARYEAAGLTTGQPGRPERPEQPAQTTPEHGQAA